MGVLLVLADLEWFWVAVDGFAAFAGLGCFDWFGVTVTSFGWLWMVLAGFVWFWVVLTGFGWL